MRKRKNLTSKQRIEGLVQALNDVLAILADEKNIDFTLDIFETANSALSAYAPTPEERKFYKKFSDIIDIPAHELPNVRYSELCVLMQKKGLKLEFKADRNMVKKIAKK